MTDAFTPVSLENRQAFYALWQKTPQRSLDYTLPNLWGWQEHYGLEWFFDASLCWIRQRRPAHVYWAPVGDWTNVDWAQTLQKLPRAAPARSGGNGESPELQTSGDCLFVRIPETLVQIWQKALPALVQPTEDRGQWEYLYKQKELATLPGNRFHKKRNHYNSYIKVYGKVDYRRLDDALVDDVLSVQDTWCQWHDCEDSPSLQAENDAVNRVLSHWNCFCELTGGSLYVDGKMVAFSIGERLDAQSLGVHYEKGLNGFRGVYQTINCVFSKYAGAGFTYINRAQDLDEEGLRQAKLTYLPTDFLRKYSVRVHGL
ncbi:MAG: conserved hypothetical protein [Candidatus Desulfovibrio kirbyi]|uniref:Phosphatidylglycerol lysyltransferase C-terminal domain-containing protein n=1 Tax=Candidatus Desulfovibrio kirbyi TaxID=2696086 RepID=A0A6L2R5W4_9BACT|nr:MAG: conserved hypothetical protein [Candidatus Desulfovibrio kirbyi]